MQGSVETCVNYGRIFINFFTANLLQSMTVKEFENQLAFRGVTGKNKVAPFFRTRCTLYSITPIYKKAEEMTQITTDQ